MTENSQFQLSTNSRRAYGSFSKLAAFAVCILLLAKSMTGSAQEITPTVISETYKKHTIYLQNPSTFTKNGVRYYGASKLKAEFTMSPMGMELYIKSRRNRGISTVISLAGSAASIAALISGNRGAVRTVFWTGLGTGLVGGLLNMHATKQLHEAVWIRNYDALLFSDPVYPLQRK